MALGDFLTTEDVANVLGVTTGRVRQFVVKSRLKTAKKIGQVLFFDRDEVEEFRKKPRLPGRPSQKK